MAPLYDPTRVKYELIYFSFATNSVHRKLIQIVEDADHYGDIVHYLIMVIPALVSEPVPEPTPALVPQSRKLDTTTDSEESNHEEDPMKEDGSDDISDSDGEESNPSEDEPK